MKRFAKRSGTYKVISISLALSALALLIMVIAPALGRGWETFGSRTPLGAGSRVPILISMDHLTTRQIAELKARPTALAAHRIRPRLELVGVGEEVVERRAPSGETQTVLRLGLLPDQAEAVLKSDSRVSLRVQAPSVELLAQDLLNSPRGQGLKRSLSQSKERLQRSWLQLLPLLKNKLTKYFDTEELRRKLDTLIEDETVLAHLKEAFMTEVAARVDLDQVGAELVESEALATLGDLTTKHVSFKDVTRQAFGGGVKALKREVGGISGEAGQAWSDGVILSDVSACALKVASFRDPTTVAGRLASWLEVGESKLCKRALESPKQVAKGAAKGGAINLFKQSVQSIYKESDQALVESGKFAKQISEVTKAPVLLEGFWSAVNSDEALARHVKQVYGEDVLIRFQLALRDLSASPEVAEKVEELKREVQQVARQGFKAILLDREGRGPNPLLLSVIQEQLSGEMRPVVHIIPGEGASVKPGYLFTSSEAITR